MLPAHLIDALVLDDAQTELPPQVMTRKSKRGATPFSSTWARMLSPTARIERRTRRPGNARKNIWMDAGATCHSLAWAVGHARGRRAPGGRREVVWCGLRARCPRRQSPNHTYPPVREKREAQSSSTRGTTGLAHFMTRVRIDVRHATVCERCVRGRRRAVRLPAAPWRVASEGTAHCCSLEHGQALARGRQARTFGSRVGVPTEQCIFSLDSRDDQRACWGRPGRRRASFRRATPRNTGLT